jgi:hypothetical protein
MVVKFGAAACAAALLLSGGIAHAKGKGYVSSEGEWTLNVAQTHYPAMMPVIKDHVMQVKKDDGKVIQYTDNFRMGDGPMTHVSLDGTFDGKPHKMTNGQDMLVMITDNGYHDQWIAPTGTTGWDNCEYSKHVTVMTCHAGFIPPGSTTPVTFVEVWNKTK